MRTINYKFIVDFEYFLRNRKPVDHQKTCKIIKRFRKVVGLAQKLDWLKIDSFRNYHIKFKRVEMGFLEPDEQKCWDIRHFRLLKFI
ncbi:MAG: phage integrase SAM-like domain-containing protein [Prolixibacteraceae bacterium]|nr:phage integrase SAM-like domain-containing protein [Prolixibacteraceae bacterium]